ncbi:MAG: hypothetical protein AAB354_11055 [candidate division KSB1 bacterium]
MKLLAQKPSTQHAAFAIDFIWVALASALFLGFALGAHLSFVIGFDFPLGKGFYAFIQTHGHVQLIGWAGMFIMGISLHFLPRLAGVPLARPQWLHRILGLMAAGLVLRSLGHSIVPYLAERAPFAIVNWLTAFSGLLEWCGVLAYVSLLVTTFFHADRAKQGPAVREVAPFFMMMLAGWLLYASLNLAVLVHMAWSNGIVVSQAWNELAIETFVGLVLLPVAFAFSVRMFPLYLRLRPPDWPVRKIALTYLGALTLQLASSFPPLQNAFFDAALMSTSLGKILKASVILVFVWQLDVLTRRQLPWTVKRKLQPSVMPVAQTSCLQAGMPALRQANPERQPTRPGLPDYGEFGRFEWLVYSAYGWLVLGAAYELLSGAAALCNFSLLHGSDAGRHIYLLGFITNLILGMAVRMIPGFMGKKKIARPALVSATFWLGNGAALFRVLPLIVPAAFFEAAPGAVQIAQAVFSLSGALGLCAIAGLAINLWKTV